MTKAVSKFKPGQVVIVYCDPLTRNDPEGKAKLLKLIDGAEYFTGYPGMERWAVQFVGETETVERVIGKLDRSRL